MEYNLLICISNNYWTAIDVNSDGKCDRISFDGNETMSFESNDVVLDFCAQILNYYNINSFEDIELNIKVIMISGYSNFISDLFFQIKNAKSIDIIDVKNILPIYILKNIVVKPGTKIEVKCFENIFTLQVDNNLLVSYINDKAEENIIMKPEWFSILFRFDCKNLISDNNELKSLKEKYKKETEKKQKEIDEQKEKLSDLKKNFDELNNNYIQLQNEIERNKSKLDAKRTILRYSEKYLNSINSKSFLKNTVFTAGLLSLNKKTDIDFKNICQLLKSDGDIVKKGTILMEITKKYNRNNGIWEDLGLKYIIKANADGRIFYLVNNGDSVKENEVVALLSDSSDKRNDIMKWYNEMK